MAAPIPPISVTQEARSSADARFNVTAGTGSFFAPQPEGLGLYNSPSNLVGGTLIKTSGYSSIALYAAVAVFAIALLKGK